jgi:glucose-1-phosphate thymidylyltransferase
MNVIIPVAGEGTRLRPLTHTTPKALIFVAGNTILGHILDSFRKVNVDKFVLVVGSYSEAIAKFCKRYDYNFNFVIQKQRLGLGHAVYLGARNLKGPTVVLLGDTIIDYDFSLFKKEKSNILAVKEVDDPQRFGIVETKDDKVINLVEKPKNPPSNLAIIGLYFFKAVEKIVEAVNYNIRKAVRTKGEYQLTDALKRMLTKGEEMKITKIEKWFDCGTAAALIETNRHLLKRTHHYQIQKGTTFISPVFISDSAKISNAVIGPNVSIGEEVIISNAIIRDSIINQGAVVEKALLTESIIGENAIVRSGYKKLSVSDSSVVEFP